MTKNINLGKIISCFTIVILFSILSTSTTNAGVAVQGSSYTISAGGSVKMYIEKSPDFRVTCSSVVESRVITGDATGQYPSMSDLNANNCDDLIVIGDPDALGEEGIISINRIEITPAANYSIESLIVDGANKGSVSSYTFGGGQHTFFVTFKTVAQDETPTVPNDSTPPTTPTVTNEPPPKDSTPSTTKPTVKDATKNTPIESVAEEVKDITEDIKENEEPEVVNKAISKQAEPSKKSKSLFCTLLPFLILLLLLLLLLLFLIFKRRREEEDDPKKKKATFNIKDIFKKKTAR